jgi:acyl carrier protein
MNKNTLIEKINAILAEEFEIEQSLITPEKPLMETLDMDSLDLVDMVVLLEQNFGFKPTQQEFAGIVSFQDFYDFVEKRVK